MIVKALNIARCDVAGPFWRGESHGDRGVLFGQVKHVVSTVLALRCAECWRMLMGAAFEGLGRGTLTYRNNCVSRGGNLQPPSRRYLEPS
jgi:hypothetical protein